MSSIPHDPDLDRRAVSPVLGSLEPVWKTAAPFQHAGWRWLQCTKTPNEYKVLIPPKLANDYARLLETEQTELAGENVDWEYIAYLRRLKRRMINRASKLEKYRPPHNQNDGLREIRAPACFRLKQIEKWARATESGQRKPTPEKHWHQCHEIVHPLQHNAPHPRSQTTILDQPDLLSPNSVQLDSTYRSLAQRHGSLIPPISNSPETVSLVQDVWPTPPNGGESLFELYHNSPSKGDSLYQPYQTPRSELSPNGEGHPPNPTMRAIFAHKQVQTDNEHANTTIAMSSERSVRTRSVHRRVSSAEKPSIRAPLRSTNVLPSSAVIDEDSLQLPGTPTSSSIADFPPNVEDNVLEIYSKPLGTLLRGVTSSSLGKFPIPPPSLTSSDSEIVRRPLSDPLPRKSRWKHHTNHSHRSPAKSGPSGSPRADHQAQGDNKDVLKRLTTNPRPSDASQSSEGPSGPQGRGSGTRKMENPFISGNTHRLLTPPRKRGNLTTKSFHTSVEDSNKVSLQEDVRDSGRRSFVADPVAPSHHAAPPNNSVLVKDTHSSESHASQQSKPKHRVPPSAPRRGLHSTSVHPRTQNLPSQTFNQPLPIYQHRRTDVRSVTAGVPTGESDAAPSVNADRASIFSRAQIVSFASFELHPLDAIRISVGSKETSKPSMPPTPTKSDDRHKHGSHSSMDPTPKFARSQISSLQSFTSEPLKNVVRTSSHSVTPQGPNIVPTTMEASKPSDPTLPLSPGTLNHGRRSAPSATPAPAISPTHSPKSPPSPIAAPPPDNPLHLVPSSPGTLNHGRRSASSSTTAPTISPRRSPIFPPSRIAAPPPDNLLHRVPSSPGMLNHGRRSASSSTTAPTISPRRSPIFPPSPVAASPPDNPPHPVPSAPGTLKHGRRSAPSTTAPAISPRRSPIFPSSPVAASPPDNPLRLVPTLLRSSSPQCHPLSPMTIAELEATKRPSRKNTLLGILRKTFRRLRRRRSVRWVAGIKDGIIGSDFSSRPHSLSRKSSSERDFNSTSVRRTPLKTRIVTEEGGVKFSLVFPPNFKATRKSLVDPSLPQ